MFTDRVTVKLTAGKGGNGVVSWRREKYIPKGGPFGGNGGRGGTIFLEADPSLFSLEVFRHRKSLKAQDGASGGSNLKQGRSGSDLIVKVPYGTLVKNVETGELLFDFTHQSPKWTACLGGRGGKGNACFKTPTNRAPNICTPGLLGDEMEVEFELKLIADIGLIGMPNAGKSTLMEQITHAKVKVGAYPFTTLSPNLSYIQFEDYTRLLVADVPGIIENAHQNRGLGITFLKHIERTQLLVFVIDITGEEGRDPFSDFEVLRRELSAYKEELLDRPFLVALNKSDREEAPKQIALFKERYPFDPDTLFEISAQGGIGLSPLLEALYKMGAETNLLSRQLPSYAFC